MMFSDNGGNVGGDGGNGSAGGGAGGGAGGKVAALKKVKPHGQDRSSFWVEAMTGRKMQADLSGSAGLMSVLPAIAANQTAPPATIYGTTGLVATAATIADATDSVSNSVEVHARLGSAGFPSLQSQLRQPASAVGAPALQLHQVPGSCALAGSLLMPGLGAVTLGVHPGSHSSVAAAARAAATAVSAGAVGLAVGDGGSAGAGAVGRDSGSKAMSPASRQKKSRAKKRDTLAEGELAALKSAESAARTARRKKAKMAKRDGSGGSGGDGSGGKGGKGANSNRTGSEGVSAAAVGYLSVCARIRINASIAVLKLLRVHTYKYIFFECTSNAPFFLLFPSPPPSFFLLPSSFPFLSSFFLLSSFFFLFSPLGPVMEKSPHF